MSPYKNTSDLLREKFRYEYGQRHIDLYHYFSTRAVLDAIELGLIESGEPENWQSLLTRDGVHLNDIGHHLLYLQVYNRIKELNY